MLSPRGLRTRFLLMTLSLFFDVAFVDRVWTNPDLMRASLGIAGLLVTGIAGLVYAAEVIFFSVNPYPIAATLLLIGLLFFVAGSIRGRLNIGFDLKSSQEVLRSRGTVVCLLNDPGQSSSFIEVIVNQTQPLNDENSLKAAECYLIFATEIWRESLAKKGLNIIGDALQRGIKVKWFAGKNSLSAV